MNKCLYCYKELRPGEVDFHPECACKMFGTPVAPDLPYSRDNLSGLAEKINRAKQTKEREQTCSLSLTYAIFIALYQSFS